jgi:hypothetical protein
MVCIIDSWTNRLHDGVRPEPVGELFDFRDPGVATFLDDVGGAELRANAGRRAATWR